MKFGSALVALLDALVVKVLVMGLCGWLLARLVRGWRVRALPERRELRWLVASLTLFGFSEFICAVEMYFVRLPAPVLDGFHSVSSALGMGLFGLWLFSYVDRKFLQFAQAACLLNRACAGCTVAAPAGCKMRNLLLLFAVAMALGAAPAFLASADRLGVDAARLALPFPALNAWYDQVVVPWVHAQVPDNDPNAVSYFIPASTLMLELRWIPAAVVAAAALAFGLFAARREVSGLRALAFAAGVLAYVYLELAVYSATREPVLGSLLHELAELWFLVATAELLRRALPRDVSDAGAPPS
jgi:hypothetical protein